MLCNRIHAGTHQGDVQLNLLGQMCRQVYLIRNNLRIGRHKQDIIKCNAIANNLTHYITLTFVNFKHRTLKTV